LALGEMQGLENPSRSMMMNRALVRVLVEAAVSVISPATLDAGEPTGRTIEFARSIQPILLSRCVKCHGSDEPKAGLSLCDQDSALAVLDSGERAIVPGRPGESELLRRVRASGKERMPPTGPALTPGEITALETWIAEGADWPTHWAYRPLQKSPVPSVQASLSAWARTPIDRFIGASLSQHGLSPSPEADRRSLLRRLHFDLIGLPPTPQEVDAFVTDPFPDAYERVVDRLLASPHYGERWARHWMDVVHFAESHGHDQDRPREHAWPYRDYLIRAFNEDKPYDQFVREQLAGDVLEPDDPWAIVATGFLAAGPWDESSLRDIREDSLDREIGRYLDRDDIITTVMSTFASTSVHCARCHDHKFDPIRQEEYYALQAVFAGVDKANRAFDPNPDVARRRRSLTAQKRQVPTLRRRRDSTLLSADMRAEMVAWEQSLAAAIGLWKPCRMVESRSGGGATLRILADGSILAEGNRPDKDVYTIVVRTDLKLVAGLKLEALTHESLPKTGPGRQDNGNLHLNELAVWQVTANDAKQHRPVELIEPKSDFDQAGWTIAMATDGNPNTAWGIYPEVGKPHSAVFGLKEPVRSDAAVTLRVELHQVHGGSHLLGRFRLSATDRIPLPTNSLDLVPPAIAAIIKRPEQARSTDERLDIAAYFLEQKLERQLAELPKPQFVYCGTGDFAPDGTFRPAAGPRTVQVLHRGDLKQPRGPAQPGAIACLSSLPGDLKIRDPNLEGGRRAALAHWMSDRRNALTWRSIVNRIWHYHFGRGIVDTPNDFGRMGGLPTHPELLDWLAFSLQESGGSIKSLQRLIVTSAVYRQTSVDRREGASVDGENQWLWRMHRRRLEPEAIRDALLLIADSLDNKMGGPSVKQFIESPGVHVTPNVDYLGFDVDHPAHLRRSVYRFIFRTLPDPFMDALDCPDASQWTPKRNESFTALQALATLNDKSVVRQSQRIADRLARETPDLARQIESAYRWHFGRAPRPDEAQAVARYAAEHGMANACRVLANSNEFLFVD
jgi:hypothetical protein